MEIVRRVDVCGACVASWGIAQYCVLIDMAMPIQLLIGIRNIVKAKCSLKSIDLSGTPRNHPQPKEVVHCDFMSMAERKEVW